MRERRTKRGPTSAFLERVREMKIGRFYELLLTCSGIPLLRCRFSPLIWLLSYVWHNPRANSSRFCLST
jgi:hypothetical protein